MSSPAVEGETSESTHPVLASLQDKSASPAHLFQALTAVEKALPQLLLCLKPILAQLGSSPNDALRRTSGESSDGRGVGEGEGEEAKRAVVDFLAILDEIQDTLRQSTLVLRTLKASPSTLIPPPSHSIPTPFASTLPPSTSHAEGPDQSLDPKAAVSATPRPSAAELGLYASRIEARTLGEVRDLLKAWPSDQRGGQAEGMVLDS